MHVIPSIDLRGGKAVKLVGGKPGSGIFESPSPLGLLERWESEGAHRVHVVDLDSTFGEPSRGNRTAIASLLSSASARIQIGGGVRGEADVMNYLDMGADAVIVSTVIFADRPKFERMVSSFPGRIAASIDYEGERVKVCGWTGEHDMRPESAAAVCDALPLHSVVMTDVSREGRLAGVDDRMVKSMRNAVRHPLNVAGGISCPEDIALLAACGVDGVILGRMLYDGRSSLRELVTRFEKHGKELERSDLL